MSGNRIYLSNSYTLGAFFDVPYLLPFGQSVADYARQLCLNKSGAELWRTLCRDTALRRGADKDAVIARLFTAQKKNGISETDAAGFINALISYGALVETPQPVPTPPVLTEQPRTSPISPLSSAPPNNINKKYENATAKATTVTHFAIGGLLIAVRCPAADAGLLASELRPFETAENTAAKNEHTQIQIDLIPTEQTQAEIWNAIFDNATPIVRTDELCIYVRQNETGYIIRPQKSKHLIYAEIPRNTPSEISQKNASDLPNNPTTNPRPRIRYTPPKTKTEAEALQYEIFQMLRLVFSVCEKQIYNRHLIHSASFLYRNRAVLVAAPSGTGKSTHVFHWKELCSESEIEDINGDLNLIENTDKTGGIVHGIPWNGTSDIFRTGTFPLGEIIILHRESEKNGGEHIEVKPPHEQALAVYQRLISPFYTEKEVQKNASFAEDLARQTKVYHLYAKDDISSARLMKERIDRDRHYGETDGTH